MQCLASINEVHQQHGKLSSQQVQLSSQLTARLT
jgi:hypothetical protein